MADITVVHPSMRMSGCEAVCMSVLEALQTDHSITLLTINEFDIREHNDFFGTNVDPSKIEHNIVPNKIMSSLLINNFSHQTYTSCIRRLIKQQIDREEIVVSTQNEICGGENSIEYIHFPQLNQAYTYERTDVGQYRYLKMRGRDAISNKVLGYSKNKFRKGTIIANSEWTADYVQRLHGFHPDVIYPPVNTEQFKPTPEWSSREKGFAMIGRINPSKNILQGIRIIDELVARDHDIHLHIVGVPGKDTTYVETVQEHAEAKDHLLYEGNLSRENLIHLLHSHKFGLHTMLGEHFGIAVAEMVAAGMIPVVPNNGGQNEIVGRNPDLSYEDADDAIHKIERILQNPELATELRKALPDIEERYGTARFKRDMRAIVTERI